MIDLDETHLIEEVNKALKYFDQSELLFALNELAQSKGITHLSQETGITREALYKILHVDGNPRLDTLFSILKSLSLTPQVIKQPFALPPNNNVNVAKFLRPNSISNFPALLSYWHTTKNGTLRPFHITCSSRKKVWWLCKYNSMHEWQSSPVSFIKNIKANLFKRGNFSEESSAEPFKYMCQLCK